MKRRLTICGAVVLAAILGAAAFAATPVKDEPIPLLEMEKVPLTDAIRQLARKAQLNILLDPRLSLPPYDRMTVSIRWEKVTAREALDALLDNYGLALVDSPR